MPASYRGQYYAVRLGARRQDDCMNVKFTKTRVSTRVDACIQTFGRVSREMFVKGIGPSKTVLMSHTNKLQIIDDPDGWVSMAEVMEVNNADTGTV